MHGLDDDAAPPPATWLPHLVMPGRPITFIAAGCQIVVAREADVFDVALVGVLNRTNRRVVGEVLEVIVAIAGTLRLSLRRLTELDDAGSALLNDIADTASRSHVGWLVVDGNLMWHGALDRLASNARASAVTTASPPAQGVTRRQRRQRPKILPAT